ncbi:head-tail connector protein [Parasphingorhabdus cellanae]|uniref:Phage head-tail connector protein n=1 Tax=Parasphingorhabdus cellanae TaxID=2806553 RepID=A0ABX7T9B1_9SPHN|nr:phage head-tail connector protein [Parasphingorhabdus cellanae]QTD57560.1 phage head-tail connector protein [Parasphingorhabdus cellanae]
MKGRPTRELPPKDLPALPVELIQEVKDFLRLDHGEDDAAIARFASSAAHLCENFTGQMLIVRSLCDRIPARADWQKLKRRPVQAITSVEAIAPDGNARALPANDYAIDIDGDGVGWVKLRAASNFQRIAVTYNAGLAVDWMTVPTTLRQGVVRLAGYLYSHRDGLDAAPPPSAVTALWRPHRRMRLA